MGNAEDRHIFMPNNLFVVEIKDCVISFARVSNVTRSIEYDTIQEGGINDYVHTFKKPYSQTQTITMEKGVSIDGSDALRLLGLRPGARLPKPIVISVYANVASLGGQRSRTLRKTFEASGCMVTKWELGDLDAMGNEILVERFEFSHRGIVEKR